jgi:hypothetical protein
MTLTPAGCEKAQRQLFVKTSCCEARSMIKNKKQESF